MFTDCAARYHFFFNRSKAFAKVSPTNFPENPSGNLKVSYSVLFGLAQDK
jgi:hypothetical protein